VSTAQTRLGTSPFPGKAPKPKRSYKDLDLSVVKKTRDPYKPERVINEHKYDDLFAGVQEGDCFTVDGSASDLSALARALRLYMARHRIEGLVRQQKQSADGLGRVWLLRVFKDGRQ
jgi:hypothetical protein